MLALKYGLNKLVVINIKRINSIREYSDVRSRYYITTCGKVISMKNKKIKILKSKTDKYGYEKIILRKINGRNIDILIHKLVALAFIDNTENKPQINHKNEIKTDNYVKNLEWVTRSENVNYGTRNERASRAMKGKYSGCKSYKAKNKEYYANNARLRGNFKKFVKVKVGNLMILKKYLQDGIIIRLVKEKGNIYMF